ncbi:MAG: 3-oxoacyl-[acyl-carrier-protein] synthase III C-terminal domain-containing protein [Myxococcales bacterium]
MLNYFAWVIAAHRCRDLKVKEATEAQAIMADVKEKVWAYGVTPEHIRARQLNALPSLSGEASNTPGLPDLMSFEDGPQGGDLRHKMKRYKDVARAAFEKAYDRDATRPSSLIHVTCAGYVSPSAAQEFVSERGWNDTGVTHSYHMGCYGAFPPVKMATGYLARGATDGLGFNDEQVDIVHTEFLSLHGDYSTVDPGSLVNMTLFADGFAKYSVVRKSRLAGRPGLEVVAQFETIIPDTSAEMTWAPTGRLFEMYLARTVPLRIKQHIRPFVAELCRRAGLELERDKEDLVFAIHPGGPKILDHIKQELGITEQQMHWSREVLNELGNMSSSTIPHIWSRMLESTEVGTHVVSMAFGPGLTATGLVLRRV